MSTAQIKADAANIIANAEKIDEEAIDVAAALNELETVTLPSVEKAIAALKKSLQ